MANRCGRMDEKTWILEEASWTMHPQEIFRQCRSQLKQSILFYPTATLWSVGCVPEAEALRRLEDLKQRDIHKPFLLIWKDHQCLLSHLNIPDSSTQKFIQTYLGQSVTLVLPWEWFRKCEWIPKPCISGERKVAVRIDPLLELRELIHASGYAAWISTSVNFPGQSPEKQVDATNAFFQSTGEPKILFLSTKNALGQASTLVDVRDQKVLRPGPVVVKFEN